MKRLITLLLCLAFIFSLCGCSLGHKTVEIQREKVDAIVISVSSNARYGWYYINVKYGEAISKFENKALYEYYNTRLGDTIPCYMITEIYENGKSHSKLVYNQDLLIPEGELIHPEDYTFPKGVDE